MITDHPDSQQAVAAVDGSDDSWRNSANRRTGSRSLLFGLASARCHQRTTANNALTVCSAVAQLAECEPDNMPSVVHRLSIPPYFDVKSQNPKQELLEILARKSVFQGSFTLASGAQSDLYIDARLTTLDPRGAQLVGQIGWQLVKQTAARFGKSIDAIGGLTMGADPVALSIGMAALVDDPHSALQVFTVRKSAKIHGRHKLIEGNFAKGNSVVVVDDVITTGGSTLQAIDAVESEGGRVAFVFVLVDRQEGGRDAIEQLGHKVVALFNRADLTGADTAQQSDTAVG